jgi:hypothetical protein
MHVPLEALVLFFKKQHANGKADGFAEPRNGQPDLAKLAGIFDEVIRSFASGRNMADIKRPKERNYGRLVCR